MILDVLVEFAGNLIVVGSFGYAAWLLTPVRGGGR